MADDPSAPAPHEPGLSKPAPPAPSVDGPSIDGPLSGAPSTTVTGNQHSPSVVVQGSSGVTITTAPAPGAPTSPPPRPESTAFRRWGLGVAVVSMIAGVLAVPQLKAIPGLRDQPPAGVATPAPSASGLVRSLVTVRPTATRTLLAVDQATRRPDPTTGANRPPVDRTTYRPTPFLRTTTATVRSTLPPPAPTDEVIVYEGTYVDFDRSPPARSNAATAMSRSADLRIGPDNGVAENDGRIWLSYSAQGCPAEAVADGRGYEAEIRFTDFLAPPSTMTLDVCVVTSAGRVGLLRVSAAEGGKVAPYRIRYAF